MNVFEMSASHRERAAFQTLRGLFFGMWYSLPCSSQTSLLTREKQWKLLFLISRKAWANSAGSLLRLHIKSRGAGSLKRKRHSTNEPHGLDPRFEVRGSCALRSSSAHDSIGSTH